MLAFWAGLGPNTFPRTFTSLHCRCKSVMHFGPCPHGGSCAHPHRDSDVVESVRHKLGELTDLHGLKRLVLVRLLGQGGWQGLVCLLGVKSCLGKEGGWQVCAVLLCSGRGWVPAGELSTLSFLGAFQDL